MEELRSLSTVLVSQKKEMGEILTGFETRNSYEVMNESGESLLDVHEVGGNALVRMFLKASRPFNLEVTSASGALLLNIKRPFRFYFHEIEIVGENGELLGFVKREFSLLRKVYSVMNGNRDEIYKLFGPIFHPWTFEIQENGREVGKITKKWSGLLKESFTDADNFGVIFPDNLPLENKSILLGAVFLIDFVHFENRGN